MDKGHVTNGKALLTKLPLLSPVNPSEALREVLIEVVVGFRDGLIGLEPSCESSVFGLSTFQDLINLVLGVEDDCLLILKMNGETIDCGLLHVHGELKDVPASFDRTNVATINIFPNLIHLLCLADLYCGKIMTLVDVLVDVLDGFDRCADLDIDVAVVLGRQMRGVGDDITIVKDVTSSSGESASIVWPGILGITVISKTCGLTELLAITLAALTIHHAGRVGMLRTARAMQHAGGDGLVEHGVGDWVRELGRDNAIDLIGITNFVLLTKEYEEVYVRETTLLELDSVDQARYFTKETTPDVLEQGFHFLIEDTCNNVRTICSCLMTRIVGIVAINLQQGLLYLWPVWICSHGQKEIWLLTMSGNGHGVLEELVHVTGAARMSGRQDDASSLLAKIGLSCIDGITNTLMNYFQVRIELNMKQLDDPTLIEISPDILLVVSDPVEFTALD